MNREVHVRFWESAGVQFPRATHLPLHRQEGILARHGVDLSRKTLCGWVLQSGEALKRLVQAMKENVLQSRVIHTDDTAVPVQVPGKKRKTHKGYLWVYVGDDDHPYTLYDFTWTRGREGPERYLLYEDEARCYRGYLQADAYAGYDRLYVNRAIVEAGCMAHARRKYYDARTSAAVPAHEALRRIKAFYAIEARAKEADDLENEIAFGNGDGAFAAFLRKTDDKLWQGIAGLLDGIDGQALFSGQHAHAQGRSHLLLLDTKTAETIAPVRDCDRLLGSTTEVEGLACCIK